MVTFPLDCALDGGLLLGDEDAFAQVDDVLLHALMIALDEEGRTALRFDFPGEEWSDVYSRMTLPLQRACAQGTLFFENLGAGLFHSGLEVGSPGGGAQRVVYSEVRGRLHLPSGMLHVHQAGAVAERPRVLEEPLVALALEPGIYCVSVLHLARTQARRLRGVFGEATSPALLLELRTDVPREDSQGDPSLINFTRRPTAWRAAWDDPADLVLGVVKRVEDDRASFQLIEEWGTTSGYAHAPLQGARLSVGQQVPLRLLRKTGGRWEAEIAR
jgi:hypothetical protein